ncbi:I78 family peptidase inhibitor [Diaphorobacter aerolatus]|uniref:Proteinase inhibitor I78 n=1 Tax=Diaphorobacter aerolatus TaxID=1288495 RepID=A0A7H0GIC8_9BURK|nr:I78 family peptidase inhibitor [Diaphorobacter aerolatus]QNP48044.1 proteinase inhibitor I78 [Diaphorobacter aerolatus]
MRSFSSIFLALGTALVVAGCSNLAPQQTAPAAPAATTTAPPPSAPEPIGKSTAPPGDICNTQAAQWAVGKTPTVKVTEDARVRSGARMARVLRPGQVVTKEFDQQRLNLEIDAGGKIIAARCG